MVHGIRVAVRGQKVSQTYVEDPIATGQTQTLTEMRETAPYSDGEVETANKKLAKLHHTEVSQAVPKG